MAEDDGVFSRTGIDSPRGRYRSRQRLPAGYLGAFTSLGEAAGQETHPPAVDGLVPRPGRRGGLAGGARAADAAPAGAAAAAKEGKQSAQVPPSTLLMELNENLRKFNEHNEKKAEDKRAEKRKLENAERASELEAKRARLKPMDEYLSSVSAEDLLELKEFQQREREYQRAFDENVYVQYAIMVAVRAGHEKTRYKYIINTYRQYAEQVGMDWSGVVLGGPERIAEKALRMLPHQGHLSTVYTHDGRSTNTRPAAVAAQMESEEVRKELYKAIREMRKRQEAVRALKQLSRLDPGSTYREVVTVDLRTITDGVLNSVYTIRESDWDPSQLPAEVLIRYKRSRLLLAAAVSDDIIYTRGRARATPSSRMDKKLNFGARGDAMMALAKIPMQEILANSQFSAPAAAMLLPPELSFHPPAPPYSRVSTSSEFRHTSAGNPISSRF